MGDSTLESRALHIFACLRASLPSVHSSVALCDRLLSHCLVQIGIRLNWMGAAAIAILARAGGKGQTQIKLPVRVEPEMERYFTATKSAAPICPSSLS